MKRGLLRLAWSVFLLTLLGQVAYADMVDPTPVVTTVSLVIMLVLGLVVVGIVFASYFVIRAIKRKSTSQDAVSEGTN